MGSFDEDKPAHSGRRGVKRDAGASGKRRNAPDEPVYFTGEAGNILNYPEKRGRAVLPPDGVEARS